MSVALRFSKKQSIPEFYKKPFEKKGKEKKKAQDEWLTRLRTVDERRGSRPSFIGVDCGRAKLFFTTVLKPGDNEPSSSRVVYTRKQYLHDTAYKKREKAHRGRLKRKPALEDALSRLAFAGQDHSILSFPQMQKHLFNIL